MEGNFLRMCDADGTISSEVNNSTAQTLFVEEATENLSFECCFAR